jgi:hypothetical protein
MQHTTGAKNLDFAKKEFAMLANLVPSLNIKVFTPSQRCKSDPIRGLRGDEGARDLLMPYVHFGV